jgi:hypothetical protein
MISREPGLSPSYDLAPPLPPPPRSATHRKIEKERQLPGEGEGVGEEPNQTTARKPAPI